MSKFITSQKYVSLNVAKESETDLIVKICKALSVPERVSILRSVLSQSINVSKLATDLKLPLSSISRHINVLEDAGLIHFSYKPSQKGHFKFCSKTIHGFEIKIISEDISHSNPKYSMEMPIGMFSECNVTAPCGMTGSFNEILGFDNPKNFFSPKRTEAECLWFNSGFISYNFPKDFSDTSQFSEISFSFEVCSETPYYNNHWPSDITIFINGIEILTFTSPGDFGGRRGIYTPLYWPISSTQYGLLKKVTVTESGVLLDGKFVSDNIKLKDLAINDKNFIKLAIGVKNDALHKGGINLFGKNFGDYPQSIIMELK